MRSQEEIQERVEEIKNIIETTPTFMLDRETMVEYNILIWVLNEQKKVKECKKN